MHDGIGVLAGVIKEDGKGGKASTKACGASAVASQRGHLLRSSSSNHLPVYRESVSNCEPLARNGTLEVDGCTHLINTKAPFKIFECVKGIVDSKAVEVLPFKNKRRKDKFG
jgi:hypothetical protein